MLAQIFLKCLRFTLFSKEKGKRKFEFVAKTQFRFTQYTCNTLIRTFRVSGRHYNRILFCIAM